MAADASQIPLIGGEWTPLVNLLSLNVEGLDHPLYLHEVPSLDSAKRIAAALRIEVLGEPGERESVIDALKLQVPPLISIESATWIRSRRTIFFETDIRDGRGMRRFMTLAAVSTEDAAVTALVKLNLPLPLVIDNTKSMLEIVAELYVLGKTEKEIASETGYDADTVRRNVHAFKRYQAHRFEEEKVRQSDKPKPSTDG